MKSGNKKIIRPLFSSCRHVITTISLPTGCREMPTIVHLRIGRAHPIKSDASTSSTNFRESPSLSLKASSMSASYSSDRKMELLRRVIAAYRLLFISRKKYQQCLESYPFVEATLQELSREQQDQVSAKISGKSTPTPDDMITRLRKENELRWVEFSLCMAKF